MSGNPRALCSCRLVASSRRRYLRLAAAPPGCCIATNRVPVYVLDVCEPSPRANRPTNGTNERRVEKFNSFTTVHSVRGVYDLFGRHVISHAQLFTFYTLAVDTLYCSISVGRQMLEGRTRIQVV